MKNFPFNLLELQGGIGNLLFQYTGALKISKITNSKLLVYEREPDTIRRLESFLEEKLERASKLQSLLMGIDYDIKNSYLRFIIKVLKKIKFILGREFHGGILLSFEENSLPLNLIGLRLNGYYQHPDYYQNEIKYILDQIINKLFKVNKSDIEILNQTTMHLRRGDYVQKGKGWSLTKKYYLDSLKLIDPNKLYPVLMISDDPFATDSFTLYLKELGYSVLNLPYDKDYDNIEKNIDYLKDYHGWPSAAVSNLIRDFKILTQSKNLIMSNSSFSWWAASLGDYIYNNEQRKVVYPDGWIGGFPDVLHKGSWIKMGR